MMGPDVYTYVYHVAVTQMYVQQTLGEHFDMCCVCIACNMTEEIIFKSAYFSVS